MGRNSRGVAMPMNLNAAARCRGRQAIAKLASLNGNVEQIAAQGRCRSGACSSELPGYRIRIGGTPGLRQPRPTLPPLELAAQAWGDRCQSQACLRPGARGAGAAPQTKLGDGERRQIDPAAHSALSPSRLSFARQHPTPALSMLAGADMALSLNLRQRDRGHMVTTKGIAQALAGSRRDLAV